MKGKQFAIPFIENTVRVNVFYKENESIEEGMPVISFGRLKTLLESGNEAYVSLVGRVSELERELEKYKKE
ncbi:hypothetical protein ACQUY5_31275 [Bacillus cereus]|uniref:hypothetical protein n=1 Tax=Bacillus cereus TaxID=1396 RepID=UPI003D17E3F2